MRELTKVVIFHEQEIISNYIYITLTFCCKNFEFHYLCTAAKFITVDPARLLHCCVVVNITISLQNILLLVRATLEVTKDCLK